MQDRKEKFKSIGNNLQPDIVSFDTISQTSLKDTLIKNRNKIIFTFGIIILGLFFFLLY